MLKKIFKCLLVLFIFVTVNSKAFTKEPDNSIKVFHLQDGHTVVIKEVHNNPIVTIDTWVRTGSINENPENNGISHFMEHLTFKGTKCHKAGEADKILESKGAVYNAATSKDFTHFYTTIASQYAETALDLQADMLLNPVIPEDELVKEKKVVQEEIRRSYDNPERILSDNLYSMLFKCHPYKYETLGSIENIEKMTRQEILDYHNKWYIPSNMITVIVGDIDTSKMLDMVKTKFNDNCQKYQNLQVNYAREPYITKNAEKIAKGNYNTGYFEIGFKGVPITDKKENYALDLAASILGQGTSSRLYQNLKEKQNLVSSISAGHESMKDDSVFFVDADLNPENYIPAKAAVLKELDKLRNEKVTPEELQRAKTELQRAFLYSEESVQDIAESIGYNMVITGDIDYYTKYIDNINKITAEDIQDTVRKYLPDDKIVLSVLMPDNVKVSAVNLKDSFKNAEKTVLNNGMTLITDKNTSNDIISLSVFIKGGQLIETIPGISSVIAKTLMTGTACRTELDISNQLENSGIIISPSANPDYFEIQLKSTTKDFGKAFEILADIINNPVFKNEYIEKAKTDIIQEIQENRDTPISYAFEKFERALFQNRPYGYKGDILEKSIPSITREDLIKFYKDYFIPENMIVSVSGNIDSKELTDKFYSYFPSKTGKKVDLAGLTTKFTPLTNNQFVSVKKDTSAAWMIQGWPVPGLAQDKDSVTLKVLNAVLGNGLSSRLFVDLREKQGLAYVVTSAYPSRLDNSFFVLYIGTKLENLETVKNGFQHEIDRIKTEPVSDKELSEAKQKLIGQFALSQETNQQKAHNLGWFEAIGKGYKYNYEYPDLINSVTSDDIIKTANKYFNSPYIISIVAPEKNVESLEKEYNSESKR